MYALSVLWTSETHRLMLNSFLCICGQMTVFPSFSKVLSIDMLYHINNTFRNIAFQKSVALPLVFSQTKLLPGR